MYVHIGGDVTVIKNSITSVIDLETLPPGNKDVDSFLKAEEESNRLQYITGDLPKTLVLTDDKTYVSPVSGYVLLKRLESNEITEIQ